MYSNVLCRILHVKMACNLLKQKYRDLIVHEQINNAPNINFSIPELLYGEWSILQRHFFQIAAWEILTRGLNMVERNQKLKKLFY